jgi:hypothetical protein
VTRGFFRFARFFFGFFARFFAGFFCALASSLFRRWISAIAAAREPGFALDVPIPAPLGTTRRLAPGAGGCLVVFFFAAGFAARFSARFSRALAFFLSLAASFFAAAASSASRFAARLARAAAFFLSLAASAFAARAFFESFSGGRCADGVFAGFFDFFDPLLLLAIGAKS